MSLLAPQNPWEARFPTGMAQSCLAGVSCTGGIKGLQVRPRAHLLQPETPSLPACSPAAAGGFTVNKTTAENDLSSGKGKKKNNGLGGGEGKNNPFFNVLIPYPSGTSFSGFPSGALMERRLSAGGCRPGKEQ